MKRYLPLLGVFLLFFLVMSGFAYGEPRKESNVSKTAFVQQVAHVASETNMHP
ncbi:hypothetical protein [Sabulibacter ruber]|uniref:hypothetical protein n=1 Tax=Sabulibacter ruber TaxID=2811901 RepID=UPI001A9660E8|nr:hypothetical protein [Sabulibacter ruber]